MTALMLALVLAAAPDELHYPRPASRWTEALPVGNGRLGAMVFGGLAAERIQFNEATIWTGAPRSYAHAGAARALPMIRQLLFEGKQNEAQALAFVGEHHPELARVLEALKPMDPKEYRAAILELSQVARTMADLEGTEAIQPQNIAEAVGFRSLDRGVWAG